MNGQDLILTVKGAITYAKTGYPIGFFNLIKSDGIFQSEEEIRAYVDKTEI